MSGPLSGFRVLDLSRVLSGPLATTLLADLGAEVIKVEGFGGDVTRAMGGGGLTAGFLASNRGKKSIAVDLHSTAGIDIIKRLASTADVFVQNFRPGAADGLGVGADVIQGVNPRIVYVSISGFGEKGPYVGKRVYDPVIQSLSGLADLQAANAEDRPRMVRTVVPDKTTGLAAAQAITAALLARERTGEGQHVRVAMLDVMISYLWAEGLNGLSKVGDEAHVRRGQRSRDLIFETKDGFITAGAISNREWKGMCEALEHPEWLDDERFRTTADRFRNSAARLDMTAEVLRTRTSAEWLERLDSFEVPCAPVLSRPEVIAQEQVAANELIFEYDHPGIGRVRQARPAARFEKTPANTPGLAPTLGQHSREVLEDAGFTPEEVDSLIDQGVLGAN